MYPHKLVRAYDIETTSENEVFVKMVYRVLEFIVFS